MFTDEKRRPLELLSSSAPNTNRENSSSRTNDKHIQEQNSITASRLQEIRRVLELLHNEILYPYYEPIEALKRTHERGVAVDDVVTTTSNMSLREAKKNQINIVFVVHEPILSKLLQMTAK